MANCPVYSELINTGMGICTSGSTFTKSQELLTNHRCILCLMIWFSRTVLNVSQGTVESVGLVLRLDLLDLAAILHPMSVKNWTINHYHAGLLHVEISAEVCIWWKSRCTLQWTSQQPVVIEPCYITRNENIDNSPIWSLPAGHEANTGPVTSINFYQVLYDISCHISWWSTNVHEGHSNVPLHQQISSIM